MNPDDYIYNEDGKPIFTLEKTDIQWSQEWRAILKDGRVEIKAGEDTFDIIQHIDEVVSYEQTYGAHTGMRLR